jgi:hypothetical protein
MERPKQRNCSRLSTKAPVCVGGIYDDRDREGGRDGGCGPEIDAKLRVRIKDISAPGSMLFVPHRLHRPAVREDRGAGVELGFHDNGSRVLEAPSVD